MLRHHTPHSSQRGTLGEKMKRGEGESFAFGHSLLRLHRSSAHRLEVNFFFVLDYFHFQEQRASLIKGAPILIPHWFHRSSLVCH